MTDFIHTTLTAKQFQHWQEWATKAEAEALLTELNLVANEPSRVNLYLAAKAARRTQCLLSGDDQRLAGEIAAEIEASLGPR